MVTQWIISGLSLGISLLHHWMIINNHYGCIINPILVGGFKPSEKYQSIGMIIPNIWKNKKCSQTTNQQQVPPIKCFTIHQSPGLRGRISTGTGIAQPERLLQVPCPGARCSMSDLHDTCICMLVYIRMLVIIKNEKIK